MTELSDADWVRVAALDDFGGARQLVREVRGFSVLLQRIGSDVVALNNVCTHLGKPLDGGRVFAGQIICPFHGACFDLRSGAAVSGPAVSALRCFPVKLDGGDIHVNFGVTPPKTAGG